MHLSVFIYIHNKYTQYTRIYYVNCNELFDSTKFNIKYNTEYYPENLDIIW